MSPQPASHTYFLRKIYMHSAWTSGARPSVASTLTLKQRSRVHQNTPFSFKKFSGNPRPHPSGRGIPLTAPTASTLTPSALNPWPPYQNPKYATGIVNHVQTKCLLESQLRRQPNSCKGRRAVLLSLYLPLDVFFSYRGCATPV